MIVFLLIAALRRQTLEQLAEKLGVALDFGWRSAGAPSTPALGVMGWSGLPLR
jgi:hypothetical protein